LRASDKDHPVEATAAKLQAFETYFEDDGGQTESTNKLATVPGNAMGILSGAKSADDLLAFGDEQPAEHSDAWIRLKVESGILFHRNVSGAGITVFMKDGIVTMQGEASSLWEKELATEYAMDLDDVKEVKNNMTIAKSPPPPDTTLAGHMHDDSIGDKIDDACLTAEVKAALQAHHLPVALNVSLQAADGVVTVSGLARDATEKRLVTKLVIKVSGVGSVINNMTLRVAAAE
jgi:osmotically-inducible protein OsmY